MSNKGKKNVYTCDLGHQMVTVDEDEGVTPFMTTCNVPGCGHMARSSFYRVDQGLTPHVRWVRPPKEEWGQWSQAVVAHLEQGGLIRSDMKPRTKP